MLRVTYVEMKVDSEAEKEIITRTYPLLFLVFRQFLLVVLDQLLYLRGVVGLQPLQVPLQTPGSHVHRPLLLLVEVRPHLARSVVEISRKTRLVSKLLTFSIRILNSSCWRLLLWSAFRCAADPLVCTPALTKRVS